MKQLLITITLTLLAGLVFAAAPSVTNVVATPSTGQVTFTYDLSADMNCNVHLMISNDGGLSYSISAISVSGDIGNSVSPGTGKSITWYPSEDGMVVGNYKAKVIADDNCVFVQGSTFNRQGTDGLYPDPAVMITLSSFYIGKNEVNQAEYQAVMGSNPAHYHGVGNTYPVYYVSWFNAIEYCNRRSFQEGLTPCYSFSGYGTNPDNWPDGWNTSDSNRNYISCDWSANGYRLPTEMEWMYAAKGGTQSQDYTWSGSNTIGDVAWFNSNSGNTTHAVGTLLPNELGINDMSGNVWEWCWDAFDVGYPSGDQTNPTGPSSSSYTVFRGGAYPVYGSSCRVFTRNYTGSTTSVSDIGFRVVRIP